MTAHTTPETLAAAPLEFRRALNEIRRAQIRPELRFEEIPAPSRLAPYAVALAADVFSHDAEDADELATGRFVLLFDPAGNDTWEGTFRAVTYIRASVEADVGTDPLITQVAWTWLLEALDERRAEYRHAGGTATRVASQSFGVIEGQDDTIDIEVRASWTPTGVHIQRHLEAWSEMVCSFAGLPPVPAGVTALPFIRRN